MSATTYSTGTISVGAGSTSVTADGPVQLPPHDAPAD